MITPMHKYIKGIPITTKHRMLNCYEIANIYGLWLETEPENNTLFPNSFLINSIINEYVRNTKKNLAIYYDPDHDMERVYPLHTVKEIMDTFIGSFPNNNIFSDRNAVHVFKGIKFIYYSKADKVCEITDFNSYKERKEKK